VAGRGSQKIAKKSDWRKYTSETFGIASFCDPRAEGSFDLVNLSELIIREARSTVLRH
jgi:hypothetical protein